MVLERIRETLASQFETDIENITRETDIMGDLGADSLDLVELVMMLEEEYGLSVVTASIYEYKTVGEIADYVDSLLEQA